MASPSLALLKYGSSTVETSSLLDTRYPTLRIAKAGTVDTLFERVSKMPNAVPTTSDRLAMLSPLAVMSARLF